MSQHDSQGCLFSVYGVQVGSHLHTARHHKPRGNTCCQQTAGAVPKQGDADRTEKLGGRRYPGTLLSVIVVHAFAGAFFLVTGGLYALPPSRSCCEKRRRSNMLLNPGEKIRDLKKKQIRSTSYGAVSSGLLAQASAPAVTDSVQAPEVQQPGTRPPKCSSRPPFSNQPKGRKELREDTRGAD